MRRAGRYVQAFSGLGDRLAPVDTEAYPPAQHREVLFYGRMHVLSRDGAAGPDVSVDHQQAAPRVLGTHADHHPLAGNRVLYNVPRFAHHVLLPCRTTAIHGRSSVTA